MKIYKHSCACSTFLLAIGHCLLHCGLALGYRGRVSNYEIDVLFCLKPSFPVGFSEIKGYCFHVGNLLLFSSKYLLGYCFYIGNLLSVIAFIVVTCCTVLF